jgi:pilus assembly protein CpaD
MPNRAMPLVACLPLLTAACTGVLPSPPQTSVVQTPNGANQAIVSGCPNWNIPEGASWTNASSPNFGCATAQNLAAMIVDPTDLIEGKTPGASPTERLALRNEQWRKGEEKPLPQGSERDATR